MNWLESMLNKITPEKKPADDSGESELPKEIRKEIDEEVEKKHPDADPEVNERRKREEIEEVRKKIQNTGETREKPE